MSFTGKPQLTTNAPIANDGFWPDLVVGDLVEKYRIPSEYDDGVIETGLKLAMVRVNKKLAGVKTQAVTPNLECGEIVNLQPKTSLLAWVGSYGDGSTIDGEPTGIFMYKHAVYCTAKAFLLLQFNTLNRRPQAENMKKEGMDMEQYWLDQAQSGISWLFEQVAPCLGSVSNSGVYVALI